MNRLEKITAILVLVFLVLPAKAEALPVNIGPLAVVSASTDYPQDGQSADKAVDTVVDGWPGDYTREWSTDGERAGAWLQLDWGQTFRVDRVVIFDRPNLNDQVLGATLAFSDGSTVAVGALNNDGSAKEIVFTSRVITGVRFVVDQVSSQTRNIGLAEIEIYGTPEDVGGNRAPVADAGPDRIVSEGQSVTLDGTGSYDPDSDAITYLWEQTAGVPVILDDATASQPVFTAPSSLSQDETLTFSLMVNDGQLDSVPDTVEITVSAANAPVNIGPLAVVSASTDYPQDGQSADKAVDTVVDGWPGDYTREWSTDGERAGAWLQLDWGQTFRVDRVVIFDRPNLNDQVLGATLAFSDGSTVAVGALNNDGSAKEIVFTSRVITSVRFVVDQVSSQTRNIGLAEIEIYGTPEDVGGNRAPVADAGADQTVSAGQGVTLDGTGSYDPDSDAIIYFWEQTYGPLVSLTDNTVVDPAFSAPLTDGPLVFQLTVEDTGGLVSTDEVVVTVGQTFFFDNFTVADNAYWQANVVDDAGNTSAWTIQDGELYQNNYVESITQGDPFEESYHIGTYTYIPEGINWTNYRVNAEITPLPNTPTSAEGNDVGIMFRYTDSSNYYRLSFNSRYGFTRFEKKSGGIFTPLAVNAIGYRENETLRVVIDIQDSVVHITVNDEPLFAVEDGDLPSGTIALYAQDRAKFDNIAVIGLDDTPAIILASPLAYSIATTGSVDILNVSAIAVNAPSGSRVEFVLDGTTAVVSADIANPFQAAFTNVSMGNHSVEARLLDSTDALLSSDLNPVIGVMGDYVVTVGNSLTNGVGDDNSLDNISVDNRIVAIQGYQANLSDDMTAALGTPQIVFNEGVGGDQSADADMLRIDSILDRHPNANRVLVMIGTNDPSPPVTSAVQFKENLQSIVDKINAAGMEAWVALIPPKFYSNGALNTEHDPFIQEYNTIIDGTHPDPALRLSGHSPGPDFYSYFLDKYPTHYSDEVHFNGAGYDDMGLLWRDALLIN